MSNGFKPGDVVQLKSGGPKMTVSEIEDDMGSAQVWCMWFDDKNNQQQSNFMPEALKAAD